jgi:hypothetical protein
VKASLGPRVAAHLPFPISAHLAVVESGVWGLSGRARPGRVQGPRPNHREKGSCAVEQPDGDTLVRAYGVQARAAGRTGPVGRTCSSRPEEVALLDEAVNEPHRAVACGKYAAGHAYMAQAARRAHAILARRSGVCPASWVRSKFPPVARSEAESGVALCRCC